MSFLIFSSVPMFVMPAEDESREAGESSLTFTQLQAVRGVRSLPGLGAPQARTSNAVASQPGLQRGFAVGLGPEPGANLFTPQLHLLSGPTGRCQDLVGAGFFQSSTACERHFQR